MKQWKIYISIIIPILVLLIPISWIPIDGLTLIEQRVIAIFLLAAMLWLFEPVPLYATSVLIIVLLLLLTSDHSFVLFNKSDHPDSGITIPYQDIMGTFASPIIMLFLGGFFLAVAAQKYRLDINLSRILLKPFGNKPKYLLLGIILITALFSMFMSNTATAALMLTLLLPIKFGDGDRGKTAFILAVPFAANIGGIGTIIGTPPNAIAIKYLTDENALGFGAWTSFALPFVILMLFILWLLLIKYFPTKTDTVTFNLDGKFIKGWKASVMYITFIVTIILWLLDFIHGMNAYIVALIPVAIFSLTSIITITDLQKIRWDVLWLIAGGMALGLALEKSGLAVNIIESISFSGIPSILVIIGAGIAAMTLSNFISNTATANLMMPLIASLGVVLSGLTEIGGLRFIVLTVTFSTSLAMVLPISTPPNALAYAIGLLKTKEIGILGLFIGIIGYSIALIYLYLLTGIWGIL